MTTRTPMHRAAWAQVQHFHPKEFGTWADHMSAELIFAIDFLRDRLGVPLRVNSSGRTIERQRELYALGTAGTMKSYHLQSPRDGTVQAVDLEPVVSPDRKPATIVRMWELAEQLGLFTGLGVYRWGMHFDVGDGWAADRPSSWTRIPGHGYQGADPEMVFYAAGAGPRPPRLGPAGGAGPAVAVLAAIGIGVVVALAALS